jgi:DnaJ like chaperone protein
MSATEIAVIIFGLYIGYWIVSKLFSEKKQRPNEESSQQDSKKEAKTNPNEQSPEWHEILNVPTTATTEEIRRAYKLLMHQYHPDKVDSLGSELKALAERKSKEINFAYQKAMQLRGDNP